MAPALRLRLTVAPPQFCVCCNVRARVLLRSANRVITEPRDGLFLGGGVQTIALHSAAAAVARQAEASIGVTKSHTPGDGRSEKIIRIRTCFAPLAKRNVKSKISFS